MNFLLKQLLGMIFFEPDTGTPGGETPPAAAPPAPETPPAQPPAEPKGPVYESQFSPEIREKYRDYYKDHAKLNDLMMDYVKLVDKSKRSIVVPDKEKATPEELKEFYTKMGIAQTAEEFGFQVDEKNDDMKALAKILGDKAVKAGLTKNQGKEMWSLVSGLVQAGTKASEEKLAAAEKALEPSISELHKGDKDKTAATLNRFKAFMVRIGDKELIKGMKTTGMLYNPAFVARMAEIEESLGDDTFVKNSTGNQNRTSGKKGIMGSYSSDFEAEAGGKA